jgi:hypothetical protein
MNDHDSSTDPRARRQPPGTHLDRAPGAHVIDLPLRSKRRAAAMALRMARSVTPIAAAAAVVLIVLFSCCGDGDTGSATALIWFR